MLTLLVAACAVAPLRVPRAAEHRQTDSLPIPAWALRIEVQFHDGLLAIERGTEAACVVETRLQADQDADLTTFLPSAAPTVEERPAAKTVLMRAALPAGAPMDAVRTTWKLRVPDGLAVAVTTRRGAVVVRGMSGDLEVAGGSGIVEARMSAGSACIATSSGSLILRGEYSKADVRTGLGRIDLGLPTHPVNACDIRAQTNRGEIFLEVGKTLWLDARLCGDPNFVHCDPEVRAEWKSETESESDSGAEPGTLADGSRWRVGRIGDLSGSRSGSIRIVSESPVYVRSLPQSPLAPESAQR